MSPLVTWVVWRDRYPATPVELCMLEAPDVGAAEAEARRRYPSLRIRVQSVASAKVGRLEKSLPLPLPTARHGAGVRRGQPMTNPTKRYPHERTDR